MTESSHERPCSSCGCTDLLGDSAAKFCARCGHPASDHAHTPIDAGCSDCECERYAGPAGGTFCSSCGHPRDRHTRPSGLARAAMPPTPGTRQARTTVTAAPRPAPSATPDPGVVSRLRAWWGRSSTGIRVLMCVLVAMGGRRLVGIAAAAVGGSGDNPSASPTAGTVDPGTTDEPPAATADATPAN